jgi:undecaprenyl diphosphate synthase
MINILKNISRIDSLKEQNLPKHFAISTRTVSRYKKQDVNLTELGIKKVIELINTQIKFNLPILTINIENKCKQDLELISNLITKLLEDNIITTNKIKVMIIGKWFNLPPELTDKIKRLMSNTEEYDSFFLNFLIEYSGKKELEAVIKLLTIKSNAKQIEPEKINESIIKESLYTSYFLPPEILIECGNSYSGILLWDIPGTRIYFTGHKHWLDLDKKDIDEALAHYKKSKVKTCDDKTKLET